MDNRKITKQMIEFNKTAFDNSFKAMEMVYEQNEKIFETFLHQATWMPENTPNAVAGPDDPAPPAWGVRPKT